MSQASSRLLAAVLFPALTSCGGAAGGGLNGGPNVADTALGGSGGVVGTAQGFGSVIINDLVMDIDDARFEIEGEHAGVGLVGQNQLAEGQQLVLLGDVGSRHATEVFYRSDIKGPLEATPVFDPLTGVGQLAVLGQAVKVNSATRYSGGAALDTLQLGDILEVSGARKAAGELVATFIEREAALAEYKVVGRVTAVAAPGFTVGGLVVDTQASGLVNPAVGDLVEVKFASGAYVTGQPGGARTVEVLSDLDLREGERFEIEGYVDAYVSPADFSVNSVRVSLGPETEFEKGHEEDLTLNARLEVEGVVLGTGVLEADRVIFKPTATIRVEGTIAEGGIDLTGRTVTTAVGITFVVRNLTELEDESAAGADPLSLQDLAPGDFLEIRGFLDGPDVVAAEIERDDPESGLVTRLRAPVDAVPTVDVNGDLHLSLLGVEVTASRAGTTFEDVNENPVSLEQFAALVQAGTVVEVSWDDLTGAGAVPSQLVIEEEDD